TLETMLFKKPMIIAYRMSRFTHSLAKRLVKVPYAGLPNLLANEKLVPELIQNDAHPAAISQHILDYLNHPEKVKVLQNKFTHLHQALRSDSSNSIANAVLDVMRRR
ncbi:MAG: lipid-A-disaccharide synthase, partial [Gammaproteobacteria bacterium]|nr:lipid-A-disaccharide synthase [Gammaproteobacteria bacterium]